MKTKYCLITGAGTRVGAEIAKHLLTSGYDLFAHYNSSRKGIEELRRFAEEKNRKFVAIRGDFSTRTGTLTFIGDLKNVMDLNAMALVIHSAGIMVAGRVESVQAEEMDRIMNINAFAPFLITQSLIPLMTENSNIIMISDIAADQVWRDYPIYSMSKKQLELTAIHFAKALAPNTCVNTIQLGLVMRSASETEAEWEKRVERTPMRRPVAIDDLTRTIDLLLSNRSITGSTISLDNGARLR